jgi:hypothetical protein
MRCYVAQHGTPSSPPGVLELPPEKSSASRGRSLQGHLLKQLPKPLRPGNTRTRIPVCEWTGGSS